MQNIITSEFHITPGFDLNNGQIPDPPQDQQALSDNKKQWIIDALRTARIDPDSEPQESPVLMQIDESTLFTIGNFSCITGKAKSRKTFLITKMVAAFLNHSLKPFKVNSFSNKKRVVWFDTEQSKFHVYRAFRRALRLANSGRAISIEVYDLRPYTPQERQEMINHVLHDNNNEKDIAFAVIDGIRDLVTDINDPTQATGCVTWLMRITETMEMHICTVIHQNKGDNNARGHLGTEIINKAETVISVQREGGSENISLVKPEQCRDKEFQPFAFSIDENGLPYIIADYTPPQPGKREKGPIPSEISRSLHEQAFKMIFENQTEMGRGELITQIKLQYQKWQHSFGDSKAKEFLTYAMNEKIICHNGGHTKNAKYLLNNQDQRDSDSQLF